MATRAKDASPGIVKEKRRISSSPSFPRPTNTTRKSVNTTTTTTIAPNYIKPTKPSNVDPLLKPINAKASGSTLPKPDLARRSSFGSRPLSQPKSAPAGNADRSPKPTSPVVRPKPRTERSRSSSSLKAPASPSAKSTVATTARKPVPGKLSRPATKPATTSVYKKKQPQSNAAGKTLKSTDSSANCDLPKKSDSIDEIDARKSDHEVETESCQDIHDQESICSSSVVDANENESLDMIADMVHDEQLEQIDDEAYLLSEASTVVSEIEHSEAELENKVIEVTEMLQQDHANNDESRTDAELDDDASSKKEELDSAEEKVTDNEMIENISVAAAEEQEKQALDDNNEKSADKEKVVEEASGGDEQVKSENYDDIKKKFNINSVRGSNKKETFAASNDVIEETASKLRVQRKNKVLALIGAFETVMSSQD